jgi:MazG family protein
MPGTGERFERAVEIMARLRAPGGCPWDREQTFDTIRKYTLEETYEVLEAIEARDWEELPGELGDLLLQVLFYAQMAREEGTFSIDDVLDRLSDKLVRRHPHVFGEVKADTAGEVLRNWEAIKAEEKSAKAAASEAESAPKALLAGVSSAMPALMEAHKISAKVAGVGFDWPEISGLMAKLHEETAELEEQIAAMQARGEAAVPGPLRDRLEDELGDLFFVLVNIARHLHLDSELALRRTNRKFRRRFGAVEEHLRSAGRSLEAASLEEMEAAWQAAKRAEKSGEGSAS